MWGMLERDANGSATIWTSGRQCLDEIGINGQDRLRWICLWHAANTGTAEVYAAMREKPDD
jgi:hypothetical protein